MQDWLSYNQAHIGFYSGSSRKVQSFQVSGNTDLAAIESFGEEWERFHHFSEKELSYIASQYFDILPKTILNKNSRVLDVGCGSGRWASILADSVGTVDAIDPSAAVDVASKFLRNKANVRVTHAGVDNIPFEDESFDLVMSIGVLHHVPDTESAIRKCVTKVKRGGFFYVYLYYKLDNRGLTFRLIFSLVNAMRHVISRLPLRIKTVLCDLIAFGIYLPMAQTSRFLQSVSTTRKIGKALPLSFYSDKSVYIMRNDALDRFGTQLEQRFSREEIEEMFKRSGLTNIVCSNGSPYWHLIGQRI